MSAGPAESSAGRLAGGGKRNNVLQLRNPLLQLCLSLSWKDHK